MSGNNLALACEIGRRYHLDWVGLQAFLDDYPEVVAAISDRDVKVADRDG